MIEVIEKNSSPSATSALANKQSELRSMMRGMERVLVAYSGGVDSTYLAAVAKEELGEAALCVIGLSPSVSEHQRKQAEQLAALRGLNFCCIETHEVENASYAANPANRCFFCKDELYSRLRRKAEEVGAMYILDGTNADDLSDYRPGRIAGEKHGVRSPLAELGLSKAEVREASRQMKLPTWDIPASPCLSSRIATGVPVTIERLGKVERAESYLRGIGFREFRVRVHDELARIEVGREEMPQMLNQVLIGEINQEFSRLGFRYVTLDLQGFRSGSTSAAGVNEGNTYSDLENQ